MKADLLLRYLIIALAAHLACAWVQAFQAPWPLIDAFELADTAEEQLFRSLGVRFEGMATIPIIANIIIRACATLAADLRTCATGLVGSTEEPVSCCIRNPLPAPSGLICATEEPILCHIGAVLLVPLIDVRPRSCCTSLSYACSESDFYAMPNSLNSCSR